MIWEENRVWSRHRGVKVGRDFVSVLRYPRIMWEVGHGRYGATQAED